MRKRQRKKNMTKQRPMPEDPRELAEAMFRLADQKMQKKKGKKL